MALQAFDYRFTPRKKKVDGEGAIKSPGLSGAESEVLWCLFKHGPTWDGDVPSKSGRSDLAGKGYVERGEGWNWLTTAGVLLALELKMGERKESRQR